MIKLSLLIDGLTMSVLPNFLSWNPPNTGGRGLLVEVQLRDRLVARDLDLRLLIVRRDDSRVGKEFRVGIFVKESAR